jgi:hypothetical protein
MAANHNVADREKDNDENERARQNVAHHPFFRGGAGVSRRFENKFRHEMSVYVMFRAPWANGYFCKSILHEPDRR